MPSKKIIHTLAEFQQLLMLSDKDFLREMLTKMLILMIELEVGATNSVAKHDRKAYRNETRKRSLSTGVGEDEL